MKKFIFLIVILLFAFGAGCKKKEVVVEAPPPPPPPPQKQTEEVFIKGLVSMLPQLEPGKTVQVQVDKSKFTSNESSFSVSLLPLDFTYPEGKDLVWKYMFPSVVWKYDGFQLPVVDPENLETCSVPGETLRILKESPDPSKPFQQNPTLLVEGASGTIIVLDQNGEEMPLRANWGK